MEAIKALRWYDDGQTGYEGWWVASAVIGQLTVTHIKDDRVQSCNALSREQAGRLWPILRHFEDTGELGQRGVSPTSAYGELLAERDGLASDAESIRNTMSGFAADGEPLPDAVARLVAERDSLREETRKANHLYTNLCGALDGFMRDGEPVLDAVQRLRAGYAARGKALWPFADGWDRHKPACGEAYKRAYDVLHGDQEANVNHCGDCAKATTWLNSNQGPRVFCHYKSGVSPGREACEEFVRGDSAPDPKQPTEAPAAPVITSRCEVKCDGYCTTVLQSGLHGAWVSRGVSQVFIPEDMCDEVGMRLCEYWDTSGFLADQEQEAQDDEDTDGHTCAE